MNEIRAKFDCLAPIVVDDELAVRAHDRIEAGDDLATGLLGGQPLGAQLDRADATLREAPDRGRVGNDQIEGIEAGV